jgi:hypothetical protein
LYRRFDTGTIHGKRGLNTEKIRVLPSASLIEEQKGNRAIAVVISYSRPDDSMQKA